MNSSSNSQDLQESGEMTSINNNLTQKTHTGMLLEPNNESSNLQSSKSLNSSFDKNHSKRTDSSTPFHSQQMIHLSENFQQLDLTQNKITLKDIFTLAKSNGSLKDVKVLNLTNTNIEKDGTRYLSHALKWENLTTLNLSENTIGNTGIKSIAEADNTTALRNLILRQVSIDHEGARILSENSSWKLLQELYLQQNPALNDKGALFLSLNESWINLRKLYLWECGIEKIGMDFLRRNKSWKNLQTVCFQESTLIDAKTFKLSRKKREEALIESPNSLQSQQLQLNLIQSASRPQMKKFACLKHPNEQVMRVAATNASSPLLCIECLLTSNQDYEKSTVKTLNAFVDELIATFQQQATIEINRQNFPLELEDILEEKEEVLQTLTEHIENEKTKVELAYEQLKGRILSILQTKKEELLSMLDDQVSTLRRNYEQIDYKKKKYFHGEAGHVFATKQDLINRINSFKGTKELESFLSNLIEEIQENKVLEIGGNDFIDALKDNILGAAYQLQKDAKTLPTSALTDLQEFEIITASLQKDIDMDLMRVNKILNPAKDVMVVGSMMETSILKNNFKSIVQLKEWIVPDKRARFKLHWRGSKDGWDWAQFYKRCGLIKPSLILIKIKENGKAIGGYTDQEWTPTGKYKHSNFSFIFNLSDSKKHRLKKAAKSLAIYPTAGNGPSFGSGIEIWISQKAHISASNSSHMGSSYEGDPGTGIGGLHSFTIEEFEFFECEHRKLTVEDEPRFVVEPVNSEEENGFDLEEDSIMDIIE